MMSIHNTQDVFGVRSKLIKSYIERQDVDVKFRNALSDGNEVIVYGSSKQGKTSLILRHLKEDQFVRVECSPQTQTIDIYKSILRQLDIAFVETKTSENQTESGGKVNAGVKVSVPLVADFSFGGEASDKSSERNLITEKYFEYNLALAQDVAELLSKSKTKKYIILENFHYLEIPVQESLAFDLRVFQDLHIIFIILGIWREANRLVQFNGDLLDRVTEVPVEPWDKEDFKKVIKIGEDLLNVDFSEVVDDLVSSSYDSIGVIQELCKKCCIAAGVNETSPVKVKITKSNLEESYQDKAREYGVRHVRNFEAFVDIARRTSNQSGRPSLAFPYYLIKLLLINNLDNIERGLSRAYLLDEIRKIHHRPDDVRSGDLGSFLHNITQHQISKKIQPPFVDYDRGGKVLKIIDSTLYFYLKRIDRNSILDDIANPIEDI